MGVTTVTSTMPTLPAGEVAEMLLALTEAGVTCVPPKLTAVAPLKPVPVIVTEVPPVTGPYEGAMALTTGGGAYVNWVGLVALPPGVTTVTPTGPVLPAGDVAEMLVPSGLTETMAPAEPPKFTAETA
jgi:hypothetical protein